MLWFFSFFTGFTTLLFWGIPGYLMVKASLLPMEVILPVYGILVMVDIITIPKRSYFYYKKGLVRYAAIKLLWYLFLAPGVTRRLTTMGDVAWILMDLGCFMEAGYLLARPGNVSDAPPQFAASLARYLLFQDTQPHVPLTITEASLSQGAGPRSWLVRGMALLKCGQPKSALRSLENSRKLAVEHGDYVLNGTCYFYLGLAWKELGRINYAKDQFLKAAVLLDTLPLGRRSRTIL